MINIGIIGSTSSPSYFRRIKPLIELSDNEIRFSIFENNRVYDAVLIQDKKDLVDYSDVSNVFYFTPDNHLEFPFEWLKLRYVIPLLIKQKYENKKFIKKLEKVKGLIVGSNSQKSIFQLINKNCAYIVDPLTHELIVKKDLKNISGKFKLGIECGALNVNSILMNSSFVSAILDMDVELHIATDDIILPKYYKINKVFAELKSIFKEKLFLYEHNQENYNNLLSKIDLAVIPVDMNCMFATSKPHNRPLIMLGNNIPVVASPIVSYTDELSKYSSIKFANTKNEWIENIEYFKNVNSHSNFKSIESDIFLDNSKEKYFEFIKRFIIDNL